MLVIKNIHVTIEDKEAVKGFSLKIKPCETHAVMGPNGSGKSSLAFGLMGHPKYEIQNSKPDTRNKSRPKNNKLQPDKSSISLNGVDIIKKSPDERARAGLFLAFQHPLSIPGVTVGNFLRVASREINKTTKLNSRGDEYKSIAAFNKSLKDKAKQLGIKEEFLKRSLNDGFSGGEKKKMEMLQMSVLKPKYAIIDEIDTGLDVDALKIVAKGIKNSVSKDETGVLIITHYQRILHYIKPDYVHVMINGRIVKTGDYKLAKEIEDKGYKIFKK